ncbi:major facilitator superfamily domain-containing protein [Mycena epipterygia]|nr:major facilitator superfamily domain-containing protein [Mycena epipterygia]
MPLEIPIESFDPLYSPPEVTGFGPMFSLPCASMNFLETSLFHFSCSSYSSHEPPPNVAEEPRPGSGGSHLGIKAQRKFFSFQQAAHLFTSPPNTSPPICFFPHWSSLSSASWLMLAAYLHATSKSLGGTLSRIPPSSAFFSHLARIDSIVTGEDPADDAFVGVMMTVQGLVHNFGGLVAMRWGHLKPGCSQISVNYYLSCWYKRSEFGIRAAIFFSAATVSGAFGCDLKHGRRGRKTCMGVDFILEGLATVLAGAASFWIIPDFPDTAKLLTEAERTFVIKRLQSDDQFSAAGKNLKCKCIWMSLRDWKTWVGTDMPLYAFSLFLPSIINQLGFKATPANLLTVPVYFFACCITCLVGLLADRYGHRGYFNIGSCV